MPSRQYLWQVKQQAKGNCIICGKPRAQYRYRCDVCTAKQRASARERGRDRNKELSMMPSNGPAETTPQPGPQLQMADGPAATRQSLP
jgi:hypothetical protein